MRTAIRGLAACVTAMALLTGCGHASTLSQDDQQFCSDQASSDSPLHGARDDIAHYISDQHFSSDGDTYAFDTVDLQPSESTLESQHVQDARLKKIVDGTTGALLNVSLGLDDNSVFANDAAMLRTAQKYLNTLQQICDEN